MSDLRLDIDDLITPSGNIENNITNSAFFDMLINNTEYKKAQKVELKHKKNTSTRNHISPSGSELNDILDVPLDEKIGWIVVKYITNQDYKEEYELLKDCNNIRENLIKLLDKRTEIGASKLLIEYLKINPKVSKELKKELVKCSNIVEYFNQNNKNAKDNKRIKKYISKL